MQPSCHTINYSILIRIVFYVAFLFMANTPGSIIAQNITDLEQQLNNASTPALKFEANLRLAKYWLTIDATKGIPRIQVAIDMASNLNDKKKVVEAALVGGELAERMRKNAEAVRFYTMARDNNVPEQQDITLLTLEKLEQLAVARRDYKMAYTLSKDRSMVLQAQARRISELKMKRQETEMNGLLAAKNREGRILPALLGGFSLLLALWYYFRRRSDRRIRGEMAEKNAMIEEKRRRSEQLLLNILPPAVAAELTVRNKVAARRYEHATVMFIDFVGFTKVAEALKPEELVQELDFCFSQFDAIIGRLRVEKIKTVGDAYICASGLTDRNERPADMIRAAIAVQHFLKENAQKRRDSGKQHFEARIGIHFGPVVAGVVGTKKFAYDIWGDTVNTAARLEEVCEAGRINVGAAAMEMIKSEFDWEYRGKIATKNKAEMDMYYVKIKMKQE